MNLSWYEASDGDFDLLAEWNFQLIRDEGHRNPMTVAQLKDRMKMWLAGNYRAVIFVTDEPVAYALFKHDEESVHLRQFFVCRDRRRLGIGRVCIAMLKEKIWPADVRFTVDVLCGNPGGVAFWRSVGFIDYCLTLEILPDEKTWQ